MNNSHVEDFMVACGLVPRSQSDLLALTPQFRWEFTRRHPYYVLLWRQALRWRRQESGTSKDEALDGRCAATLLGMIGVTGEPEDPALGFDQLDNGSSQPAFGAVQPMTFRNMIDILIASLPPSELQFAASLLWNAGETEYAVPGDHDQSRQRRKAHFTLMGKQSKAFDSYPDRPLYYVHMNASQRRITDDIAHEVRRWKANHSIPERRIRTEEYSEYLKVWDAREGWNGRGYSSDERTFAEIARQLKTPKSTVISQYRSAFRQIVGVDLDVKSWFLVMGQVKLTLVSDSTKQRLLRRCQRMEATVRRKPVPESQISGSAAADHPTGLIERGSARSYDDDLLLDVVDLIGRGLSDVEIAHKLELPGDTDFSYVRERLTEIGEAKS